MRKIVIIFALILVGGCLIYNSIIRHEPVETINIL